MTKYEADLSKDSLPELLVKIHRHRVPGVIDAVRGNIFKRLWVRDGDVIFATSSAVEDRIGQYLLSHRLISEKDLEEVMADRERSQERVGVLFLQRGLMSPRELRQAIQGHIEHIVWSLFSWDQGHLSFKLKDLQERNAIRIHISLQHMVFRGVRESTDARSALARLGGADARFEQCWDGETLIDIGLDADEFALLQRVDGQRTVRRISAEGPFDEATSVRLLYAFQVLGLVRRHELDSTTGYKIRLQTAGGTAR